jgi:hypothetical protein
MFHHLKRLNGLAGSKWGEISASASALLKKCAPSQEAFSLFFLYA